MKVVGQECDERSTFIVVRKYLAPHWKSQDHEGDIIEHVRETINNKQSSSLFKLKMSKSTALTNHFNEFAQLGSICNRRVHNIFIRNSIMDGSLAWRLKT